MTQALVPIPTQRSLAAALPPLAPFADKMVDLILSEDDLPTGHGKHGEYLQAVENVPTSLIWWDRDLYVFGAEDTRLLDYDPMTYREVDAHEAEGGPLDVFLRSFERMQRRDGKGIARMNLVHPLALIERTNPANPRQTLMLAWKYQPWLAAWHLHWPRVPAVISPDMSDYDIRNMLLHLRANESAADDDEIWRVIMAMIRDYQHGRISIDSAPIPTAATLCPVLGYDPSYGRKLNPVFQDETATRLLADGRLKISTAIRVFEVLEDTAPRQIGTALQHIADARLTKKRAERYLGEIATNATGAIALAGGDPVAQFTRRLQGCLTLLETYPTLFLQTFGDEATEIEVKLSKILSLIQRG